MAASIVEVLNKILRQIGIPQKKTKSRNLKQTCNTNHVQFDSGYLNGFSLGGTLYAVKSSKGLKKKFNERQKENNQNKDTLTENSAIVDGARASAPCKSHHSPSPHDT
ncbi:unnamed protein product [Dovyalis caffra]|uniref:Uncharacterized protein n=1 Tax=Dovyalis caffra TaxID=77055 RepID=A0AAV1RE80_9ROSI|nr:unnamed protein product [Dovyalis caffra]